MVIHLAVDGVNLVQEVDNNVLTGPVGLMWRACVDNVLSWTRVPSVNDSSAFSFHFFFLFLPLFSRWHFNKQVVGGARRPLLLVADAAMGALLRSSSPAL